MRLFVTGVTLLVAAALLSPISKAAPKNYTAATAQFWNRTGDLIQGDAHGAYAAAIYNVASDASQDLTFGMARGRALHVDFTQLAQPPLTPYPPTGTLTDTSAFVNIRNIGAMAVGSPEIRRAVVSTAVGQFRWFGAPDSTNLPSHGSQAVVVVRTSVTTWEVGTSLPAALQSLYVTPAGAGDISVLVKSAKNTSSAVGLYYMPFGLTVTCPEC